MTVLNTADAVHLGATPAARVYVGAQHVWPTPPASLPGPVIWFDAAALGLPDGAGVSPWPNLGDATKPGTIYAPADPTPPKLRADALNGLPVVHFLPNQGSVVMDATGVDLDYTCVFVARMVNGADRIVSSDVSANGNPNFVLGWVAGNQDTAYCFGYFGDPVPWTDDWKLYSSDCDSVQTAPTLYSDGVLVGQSDDSQGSLPYCWDRTLVISGIGFDDGEQTSDCEVAEFILYDRKLPDADRQAIEKYLRVKWLLPPSVPRQIPGLLWWADPSQLAAGDGDPVTSLPDLSGNGLTTASRFGQSPTFDADAGALLFTTASPTGALRIAGLGTALTGLSAFTVLVAVAPSAFDDYPIIFSSPADTNWQWILEFDPSGGVYCGVVSNFAPMFVANMPTNVWSLLTWVHDGPVDRLWLNDDEITQLGGGTGGQAQVPYLGPDVILGGYYNDQYGMLGDLGEMLIYSQALSDADRQELQSYLLTKWT